MPNIGNYAKVVQDWTQLLAATAEHADKMSDVTAERQELEQTLQKAEEIKARQESSTAARQVATQELGEVLAHGRDVAMRLRFAAGRAGAPRFVSWQPQEKKWPPSGESGLAAKAVQESGQLAVAETVALTALSLFEVSTAVMR